MAVQLVYIPAASFATAQVAVGDVGVETDLAGNPTGNIKLGLGAKYPAGIPVTGVAGGLAGVSSFNGLTGAVSAGINLLTDVDTVLSPPSGGESLVYQSGSGNWEPEVMPRTLAALDDTNFATLPVGGQFLKYDGGSGKWIPGSVPTGGGTNAFDPAGFWQLGGNMNLNGEGIESLSGLGLANGWTMLDSPTATVVGAPSPSSIIFKQTVFNGAEVNVWSLRHVSKTYGGPTPGHTGNFLALADYGALRDATTPGGSSNIYGDSIDVVIEPPTNFLYTQGNGAMRKARFDDAGVGIGLFGDVSTTGISNGQVLAWNTGAGKFLPAAPAVGGAGATTFTGLTDTPAGYGAPGEMVVTDGLGALSYAVPFGGSTQDLSEVGTTMYPDGHVLRYSTVATGWVVGPQTQNTLQGLVTGSPNDHDAIIYLSGGFVYRPALRTDMTTTPPTQGSLMVYNGTQWVPVPAPATGGLVLRSTGAGTFAWLP